MSLCLRDFGLLLRRNCPSGMLRSVAWWLLIIVSGHPVSPIFVGPAVQEDCWAIEDLMDRLSRSIDK